MFCSVSVPGKKSYKTILTGSFVPRFGLKYNTDDGKKKISTRYTCQTATSAVQ